MKTNLRISLEIKEKVQFSSPLLQSQSHLASVGSATPLLNIRPTAPTIARVTPFSGDHVLIGVRQKIQFEYRDVIFGESGLSLDTALRSDWRVYEFKTVLPLTDFVNMFRFPVIEPDSHQIIDIFHKNPSNLAQVCQGSWIPLSNAKKLQWVSVDDESEG